jgi:DNA replicative helicase MCM subunit Mcm2 (Cdc46/Mcm family)
LGETVTISGSLYVVRKNDNPNSRAATTLYANSFDYLEKEDSTLSENDIKEIEAWKSAIENEGKSITDELGKKFAPTIIGNQHNKKGLLYVCANAGIKNNEKKIPKRLRLNALLIGGPGLAKSPMLLSAIHAVPNSRYEGGQGSTGLSLTAQVSKDDGGTHTLRLGPIPRARGAICAINEIGRMQPSEHKHLLDFMEEGWTTINKYGFNSTISGHTSIIASSNPINDDWKYEDRIDYGEFPTIGPIIQRFDLILVFREITDSDILRKYLEERDNISRLCNDGSFDKDEEFLKKYLMFARTFDPMISEEARSMLDQYWISMAAAGIRGLPRKRDTLDRITIAIAKLKLKAFADIEEAKEAMEFYNVILLNYQQTVPISTNPRDTIYEEVYSIVREHQGTGITYIEAIETVCSRKREIRQYLGGRIDLEHNWKLRPILELIRNNSDIDVIDAKPILLRWKDTNNKKENSFIQETTDNQNITLKQKDIETDGSEVSDATKEVLSNIFPMINSNKLDDPSKSPSSIPSSDPSDTSDPSNPATPRLSVKHTQTARVFTNEDLASEDDG